MIIDKSLLRKLDKEVNGEPEWVQGDLDAKLDNGWTIPVSKVPTLYKNYYIVFSMEIVYDFCYICLNMIAFSKDLP